jgi:hypothetical protein
MDNLGSPLFQTNKMRVPSVCMYLYVCMYVCVRVCVCVCVCVHVCVCLPISCIEYDMNTK